MPSITGTVSATDHDGFAMPAFNELIAGEGISYIGFMDGYFFDSFIMFSGLNIPHGSKINSAVVHFISYNDGGDSFRTTFCNIYAKDSDDAPVPSAVNDLYETPTSTQVEFQFAGKDILEFDSPDLSAIVQEIVDRPGWQPNNKIMFVFEADKTRESGVLTVYDLVAEEGWEGWPSSYLKLDFSYPTITKANPNRNVKHGGQTTYVSKFGTTYTTETRESGYNPSRLGGRFDETQYYGS